VGGHYDSRNKDENDGGKDAPGADDDASGTAVALELARCLAGEKPAATILLCAFDGEERGLFGSDELAGLLKREGRVVEGMVTDDIVGASRGPDRSAPPARSLRCFSEVFAAGAEDDAFFRIVGGENDGPSRARALHAAGRAAPPDRLRPPGDGALRPLRARRLRLVHQARLSRRSASPKGEDYHHQHEDVRTDGGVQYGDLAEFVDFDYLANVARLNLAFVSEGAGAPPPPAVVHLDGAVKPDATVEWNEVAGEGVAGYRVWRRAPEAAAWHDDTYVPREDASGSTKGSRKLDLPGISVDDWQFAVSTVGRDGRESPVRFPTAKPKPPAGGAK
jgi:hypothetical protein